MAIWLLSVGLISSCLAAFEILIERDRGWASALNPHGWGRKLFEGSIISRICEKPYLTVYHVFMFAIVLPIVLVLAFYFMALSGIAHFVSGTPAGLRSVTEVVIIAGFRAIPWLFLLSILFSTVVIEDFLWFALNWYYPGSLQKLLGGSIWWHTKWIGFGRINIPRFYIPTLLTGLALLMASNYLSK